MDESVLGHDGICIRQPGIRSGAEVVARDGRFKAPNALQQSLASSLVPMKAPLEVKVVTFGIGDEGSLGAGERRAEPQLQRVDDFASDLFLNRKQIARWPVVRFRPKILPRTRRDQLRGDTQIFGIAAYAASEHVPNPQLISDTVDVLPALQLGGRMPGHHFEALYFRERMNELFGQPIAEVFVTRVIS